MHTTTTHETFGWFSRDRGRGGGGRGACVCVYFVVDSKSIYHVPDPRASCARLEPRHTCAEYVHAMVTTIPPC